MRLVYQNHHPPSHAILPISFLTSINLILVLFYLQLLYGISFTLRPFWSSRHGSQTFKQAIIRTERRALDIIVGIIPPPVYRSPVPSSAFTHENYLSSRAAPAHHTSRLGYDSVRSALPRVVEVGSPLGIYPGTGRRHASPSLHHENQRPESYAKYGSPSAIVHETHNHCGLTHFDGTSKCISSTICQNTALATDQHKHVLFDQSNEPKQPQQQWDEEHPIIGGKPVVEAKPVKVKPVDVKPLEMNPVDTNQPSMESPTCSADQLSSSLEVIPPSSSHYPDDSTDLSLPTNRNTKCRSTASYPGKFPVSEGLEFSSLATASHAFREKGTTSVRPFSDY